MADGRLDKKQAIYKRCRTAFDYSGSIHLVRLYGETFADDKDARKASTSIFKKKTFSSHNLDTTLRGLR